MEHLELIELIEDVVYKIYELEQINSLKGIKNDYILPSNLNFNTLKVQTIVKIREIYNLETDLDINNFRHFNCFDDLEYLSEEIAYFTATSFLYKNTINNPLNDWKYIINRKGEKEIIYINNQNLSSIRYSMYIGISYEKIYNYWDRIGDLIWSSFFQNDLIEKKLYFSTIIDIINTKYPDYSNFESFKWLSNFKENQYSKLNKIRKEIVHYNSIDTEFIDKHTKSFQSREEVEKLMENRLNHCSNLKFEINNSILGFIKVCEFIENVVEFKLENTNQFI